MPLETQVTEEGTLTLVAVTGRLDTKTSGELEKTLTGLVGQGKRRLLLDLAGLEYLSSAGLRVLLMLGKRLGGGEGWLGLCGLNAAVREVFDVAGFTPLFAIYRGRKEGEAAAPAPGKAADALAQAAARQLGVSESRLPPPVPGAPGGEDLAARAALALGVRAGGKEPPPRETAGTWVRT